MGFTTFNPPKAQKRGRARAAIAAIFIVGSQFTDAGKEIPAGVCPPGKRAERLDRTAAWVAALAAIDPAEAMLLLAQNTHTVSSKLLGDVEREYNEGVRAMNDPELPVLAPGELAARFALHAATFHKKDDLNTVSPCVTGPAAPVGRFYYIAAGIGSGISEMQHVCVLLLVGCMGSEQHRRDEHYASTEEDSVCRQDISASGLARSMNSASRYALAYLKQCIKPELSTVIVWRPVSMWYYSLVETWSDCRSSANITQILNCTPI
jgi:hypothetical protein